MYKILVKKKKHIHVVKASRKCLFGDIWWGKNKWHFVNATRDLLIYFTYKMINNNNLYFEILCKEK